MRPMHMIAAVLACSPGLAAASETVSYGYDAKGRLISVQHSGGPSNGVNAAYQYDAADNRFQVTVSGAPFDSQAARIVVVPLRSTPLVLPTNP